MGSVARAIRAAEVARYRTGPLGTESPSRTSVNLRGDVAVANRGTASVVKIAAREANCFDANSDGTIQTSSGPTDVLPWGEDECVLWTHDLDFVHQGDPESRGGPRALAWEAGGSEDDPCGLEARVWVGWRAWVDQNSNNSSPSRVRRITADGELDGEVEVGGWDGGPWQHGFYGAATDAEGNFWGIGSEGMLVRVDASSLEVDTYQRGSGGGSRRFYGMAMDGRGNPWISTYDEHGLVKFDVDRREFVEIGPAPAPVGNTSQFRGMVIDRDYRAWIAGNDPCGLARYDIVDDRWVGDYQVLPGCSEPVGVSVDHEGFIWVVDWGAERAYKVEPQAMTSVIVDGFTQPYTYSDMTGSGLKLVDDKVDPPAR